MGSPGPCRLTGHLERIPLVHHLVLVDLRHGRFRRAGVLAREILEVPEGVRNLHPGVGQFFDAARSGDGQRVKVAQVRLMAGSDARSGVQMR